jgi:hypothetical protein
MKFKRNLRTEALMLLTNVAACLSTEERYYKSQ